MSTILFLNSKKIASESIGVLIEQLEAGGSKIFEFTKTGNKKTREYQNVFFGTYPNSKVGSFLFYFSLPLLRLYHSIKLKSLSKRKAIDTVICLGLNEKIIYTKLAKKSGIKCVWIFFPDDDILSLPKTIRKKIKKLSQNARVLSINSMTKSFLIKLGISEEKINILPICVKNNFIHQGSIFENIAQSEHPEYNRRYFTIGTFNNLENAYQIEILLRTVQKSLDIIPDIQLIIVGEGPEKKNMSWAAKKMGISNLVWFIGRNNNVKKWLDSFNVYINSNDKTDIHEIETTIKAMTCGLPVIAYAEKGLDDLIRHKSTGMLTTFNHNDVVETIVQLQQNKKFCQLLGKQAREHIDKFHNPANMVRMFENKNE